MGNRILLMFALAAAPLAALAADGDMPLAPALAPAPPPASATPGSFAKADAALAEAQRAMKDLQDCKTDTAALRADWLKKERELKAEFGAVPPAFNEFLLKKRKRADKREEACLAMTDAPAQLFKQAHDILRNIEPKNMPGVAGRFKKVEAGRAQYNNLIRKPKAAGN
ncbi:MAG: hypothetical protein Q8T11_00825 [Elusimicrobiota bacterium]|nr:hypothetical protein [Elusimicrobiota bacterium]